MGRIIAAQELGHGEGGAYQAGVSASALLGAFLLLRHLNNSWHGEERFGSLPWCLLGQPLLLPRTEDSDRIGNSDSLVEDGSDEFVCDFSCIMLTCRVLLVVGAALRALAVYLRHRISKLRRIESAVSDCDGARLHRECFHDTLAEFLFKHRCLSCRLLVHVWAAGKYVLQKPALGTCSDQAKGVVRRVRVPAHALADHICGKVLVLANSLFADWDPAA